MVRIFAAISVCPPSACGGSAETHNIPSSDLAEEANDLTASLSSLRVTDYDILPMCGAARYAGVSIDREQTTSPAGTSENYSAFGRFGAVLKLGTQTFAGQADRFYETTTMQSDGAPREVIGAIEGGFPFEGDLEPAFFSNAR